MVRHIPLPYMTPGFIREITRKDPKVKLAKMRESLVKMLEDLDWIEQQERNPETRQLYGALANDINQAYQKLGRISRALR